MLSLRLTLQVGEFQSQFGHKDLGYFSIVSWKQATEESKFEDNFVKKDFGECIFHPLETLNIKFSLRPNHDSAYWRHQI